MTRRTAGMDTRTSRPVLQAKGPGIHGEGPYATRDTPAKLERILHVGKPQAQYRCGEKRGQICVPE